MPNFQDPSSISVCILERINDFVGPATSRSSRNLEFYWDTGPCDLELWLACSLSLHQGHSSSKSRLQHPRRSIQYRQAAPRSPNAALDVPVIEFPIPHPWLIPSLEAMVFKRHTSPLHFEPLSPLPSELLSEFSDSDDGLDRATRAAKWRKIERLGQDYLEGRPLFILSAGLKGPLENGWVNPWKRNTEKDKTPPQKLSLPKQDKERGLKNGVQSSIAVPSETPSRPLKRPSNRPSRVRRQGSGFESSLEPEQILELQSNQVQRQASGKDSGLLGADVFNNARRMPSNSIFSKPRAASAQVNSTTTERTHRSISSSTPNRCSVDANNSWLKTDERRPHLEEYERSTGSSPTPGYRPRPSVKPGHGAGRPHDKNRQRVCDLINDDSRSYTPPRIAFTPINGQGVLSSASSQTTGQLLPEEGLSSEKGLRSPGGGSHFSKPGKPASAFTGHSSSKKKREVPPLEGNTACKTVAMIQPPGSFQAGLSTDGFPESQYRLHDQPASSSDTISNSNCNIERDKHCRSQPLQHKTLPRSTEKSQINNSSHTLPADPTPNGKDGLQDSLQISSNATASATIPSAQIVPDHFKFPIPTISLHSTYFSAAYSSAVRRGSQNGDYEEHLSTQAPVPSAQKLARDELVIPTKLDDTKASKANEASKVAAGGEQAKRSHLSKASISNVRAITPFFSTVKRIKPGKRSEAEVATVDAAGKNKGQQKQGQNGNRARNSAVFNDPSSPASHSRSQSRSPSPKATSPPCLSSHPFNAPCASIIEKISQCVPSGESQSSNPASTLPHFNLTSSTNDTRGYQDCQGQGPGWENFDLSQAIAEAGTFLGTWDFDKVDLERVTQGDNTNSVNSIKSHGNTRSRNANDNSNSGGAKYEIPLLPASSGTKLQSILKPNTPGQ
ncbi:conserved hypothetical protein [Histoplasma capsulatum H143]|uniref:Uncharacterized protein n=1 Tax=Ajellomyces capsulatus (strain H143) TaxID=544712 RepID=C6HF82_AJECH|nr:conserved hypothetical protein [Histoplasma capsulatum H143]